MAIPLRYHWRSLFVRKMTTVLTMLVVAAVVGLFAWMFSFSRALADSMSVTSDDRIIVVLKPGATAEGNSAIRIDDFNLLQQIDGAALNPTTGGKLISPEVLVQVSLPRARDPGGALANIAVRGVTELAFDVHRSVKRLGKSFEPGRREVIVGVKAANQFAGLSEGSLINLGHSGDQAYRVVGLFTAEGGPAESEIWGYLPELRDSYKREMYSSANVLLDDGAVAADVIKQIKDPAIELEGQTEGAYWSEQTKNIVGYLIVAGVLVGIMSLAAIFSIANTMYAAVAGRTREIAMLRTIGFPKSRILFGFVLESLLLSLPGGIIGCIAAAAWLKFFGNTKDMFGASTFTTLAFEIRMNTTVVFGSLGVVMIVAVLGSLMPARRAARLDLLRALREP